MSMRPKGPAKIPVETVRVARAAFPRGSLAIRLRDELGVLFVDEQFMDLFPARGKPAWSPGRLALVLVLQFVEGLTDRQAAEAVRARIDFKYALGLRLGDPGFDFTVLTEFRDRLLEADGGRRVLDGILVVARDKGLLKTASRARTDSTHVLAAVRNLSALEMVAETLRAALNTLAREAPDWLREIAEPDWFDHYATRAENFRFPKSEAQRDEVRLRIGRDGTRLLRALWSPTAPDELRALKSVEVLRRVWVQQFHLVEGEVACRSPKNRPPGATRLGSPYDPESRGSIKRDTVWHGYKVHLTETCEADAPNLITNVATTVSTTQDQVMIRGIHAELAARDCLPAEHWVDAGYPTASQVVAARLDHGVELLGPMVASTDARAGGPFGQDAFTIDWDQQQVTCPNGATSAQWHQRKSQQGLPVIRVRFARVDCQLCPDLRKCVRSPKGEYRDMNLRLRDEHEVVRKVRTEQQTDAWKDRYKIRAGVEGTISQGVGRCGLRRSRYRGLAKTGLQHQLTGAAMNLARIDAHLTHTPRAATRTSHFAALRSADRLIGGAK
ncbi:IS1182 family transposase [Streptomyces mirabilis]|uniref:IS1182 family transposase n=1 Tax=Streptomyces mirabilis TaxID=68239 RepID=UPI00340BE2CD